MNKLKLNLAHEAGEVLSKEDMKQVLGGATSSGAKFLCSCTPPAKGTWTGTYSSPLAIEKALTDYCGSDGGSCNQIDS